MSQGKKGVKDARLDLVPYDALWAVGRIFGFGAAKYADRNWERGYAWSKSYGAMQRHLALFWQGENLDEESGMPHIAHAAWHALVLLAFYLRSAGEDDRPVRGFQGGLTDSVIAGLATMVAEVVNPEEIADAKAETTRTAYNLAEDRFE